MEEKSDESIGKCFANHCWYQHQVVIVYPDLKTRECYENNGCRSYVRTDVSLTIMGNDDVCESLVHGLILSPRLRFVERFSLRSIRNSVVESGPKDLESTISLRGEDDAIGRAW